MSEIVCHTHSVVQRPSLSSGAELCTVSVMISYPEELTAEGLVAQRMARMSAILEPELRADPEARLPWRFKADAIERLREIAAECSPR